MRYLAEIPEGVHGNSGKAANERLAALTGSAWTFMTARITGLWASNLVRA